MPTVAQRPAPLPIPGCKPPIVDLRRGLPWCRRLPARLGTAALWIGGSCLLGPFKLSALLLAAGLTAPVALWLDRDRGSQDGRAVQVVEPRALVEVPRVLMAAQLGLAESRLFRARHASICTVHHDGEGRIVALVLPCTEALPPLPTADAHPVG